MFPHTQQTIEGFRPPATPLVTHDPYFSVWQMADTLTEDWSRHWTGTKHPICGMVRIDGEVYRFAGPEPETAPAMEQLSLHVHPTTTVYRFAAGGIELKVSFLSPLLTDDLDLLSRPVSYVTFEARSIDGEPHSMSLYFDVTAEWAVNSTKQKVEWSKHHLERLHVLQVGTVDQHVLEKSGDNLRIDWGHMMLAYGADVANDGAICGASAAREGFASTGLLVKPLDLRMPREAGDETPVLASLLEFGVVETELISRQIMLAYDDEYGIELFHQKLRPYWRRHGMSSFEMLQLAWASYDDIRVRCARFDEKLTHDLIEAGGEKYAAVATLAYRQCLAAHKLVADQHGQPLMFSKENFSNGCLATVDVTYPGAPFFLHFNVELLKAQLTPVLDYAQSPRWKHRFAPHDLGTYPLANGQVYGGGEVSERDQMPVEECGNMLILMGAIARKEGNPIYAMQYWPLLEQWAKYLVHKGLDPENQLCTDDFAGHLAHNANLSLKAILAIGSFAMLCEMAGKEGQAKNYRKRARQMANDWMLIADDGNHYRLAFDKKGSWSQKYNLVWDRILDLGLFPAMVAQREIAHYQRKQNAFGLPLDSRHTYTKTDWIVWSAALAEDPEDRRRLLEPVFEFAHRSPSRVPLTDWYDTKDGAQIEFQARSVIGGIYILLLDEVRLTCRLPEREEAYLA